MNVWKFYIVDNDMADKTSLIISTKWKYHFIHEKIRSFEIKTLTINLLRCKLLKE